MWAIRTLIAQLLLLAATLHCACGAPISWDDSSSGSPAINKDIVDAVNADRSAGWKATHDSFLSAYSIGTVKRLLGVRSDVEAPNMEEVTHAESVGLPDNFDSRSKWPGCIGPVLDQAECGSCWAFGAAETASDRMCIDSKERGDANATFLQLAPLDLVACDSGILKLNLGCHGGLPPVAMNYIRDHGLVTEKCLPYLKSEGGPMPTCDKEPCLDFLKTPKCHKQCADGSDFESDKHKFSKAYMVRGAESIAQEIVKNGPVEGAIAIFEDFLAYKSGVYRHVGGKFLGAHAVKIIGFGIEDGTGTPYWLIQNSWTTKWGDGGFIKMLRGKNELGIEIAAFAGVF